MFFKGISKTTRTYLDYAASTPISQKLQQKIPRLEPRALLANPSGLHADALFAKQYREAARARVAEILGAHADEIIFTSGATESDNLALIGTSTHWLETGTPAEKILVLVSELEHPAILAAAKNFAARTNIQFQTIPVIDGIVVEKEITVPVGITKCFISVMYVHNETGTVQPLALIAKRIRFLRKQNPTCEIIFHSDATQAPRYFPLKVLLLGVDLLSIGATKLPMQKGVGVLYKARRIALSPLVIGGAQESGLRAGTEPIELLYIFSHTLSLVQSEHEKNSEIVRASQLYFEKKLKETIPCARITAEAADRTPHITHISIPDFDSELLVLELDARGVSVSAQSACIEETPPDAYIKKVFSEGTGVLRFSFAPETTKKDLDSAISALQSVIKKYQQI